MQLNEAVPAKFDFVQEEFSLPTVFRFAIDVGMMVLTGTTNGDHMRADLNVFDFGREPEEVESIKRLAAGRYGHAETDPTDPFANRRTESRVNWVESSRPPRTLPMATKTVWRIAVAIALRSQVMKPPRSRLKKLYGWAVTIPPRFRLAECGKKKKRSRTKAGPGKAANLYLPRKWGFDHVSQNHDGRSSCDGVCADSFCYRQFFVSGFCQGRTRWARRTRVCSESGAVLAGISVTLIATAGDTRATATMDTKPRSANRLLRSARPASRTTSPSTPGTSRTGGMGTIGTTFATTGDSMERAGIMAADAVGKQAMSLRIHKT